ncbi:MAG: DUF2892 domain-containing protein [Chloroflexi bacterium]|nr:MAG: DUF2892 domain-containing protein [Chloroflexota bacterium]
MNALFSFLASMNGRIVRIVAGVVLILIGVLVLDAPASYIVELIGLVPLLAGLFDYCVLAPLFGLPFRGDALRDTLRRQ